MNLSCKQAFSVPLLLVGLIIGRPVSSQPVLEQGLAELKSNAPAAVPIFRHYARLRPNDPSAHFWLGLALDEANAPGQAIWAYSRSLELATRDGMDSAELRVNIGNTLMRLNRLDDAIFNYRRALEIDPRLMRAHFNLGRALIAKKDPKGALTNFDRCLELGFNEPSLTYYRALALCSMGNQSDSQEQMELFLKLIPADETGEKIKNYIKETYKPGPPPPDITSGPPPESTKPEPKN